MFIPEEARGSSYSRAYIKRAATLAKYAMVTELARAGGKVVIARKDSARFKLKTIGRPPMEKANNLTLFEKARGYALEHGLDLQYTPLTGGGSDGNFTSAEGTPTLDGLGADGEGAHTLFENILV